ncbi:unknown kinase with aarF domain [Cyanidioschyzon merolae strain 10D]|uniref:ABC1 atypical kinase-like domain-containing protein n=1 Tax=Cyanidioschyzon merolae (strain NIES-3377 / 10D) TaxID=280699 RepID=M1UWH9_CYAM1|nr:unknown kinase with aarF domain [Cyanidioschyzon merolae strain 10D]BAM82586.1 unknown kinase with aarF domain [Cyanidioschyzon merolae strain 10D]|eukprot:XP_005538622.1 unknown kinase with aarF domain [Cyanidioschyzon merolae strain 10D]
MLQKTLLCSLSVRTSWNHAGSARGLQVSAGITTQGDNREESYAAFQALRRRFLGYTLARKTFNDVFELLSGGESYEECSTNVADYTEDGEDSANVPNSEDAETSDANPRGELRNGGPSDARDESYEVAPPEIVEKYQGTGDHDKTNLKMLDYDAHRAANSKTAQAQPEDTRTSQGSSTTDETPQTSPRRHFGKAKPTQGKRRSSRGSTLGFLGRAAILLVLKVLLSKRHWSACRTAIILGTVFPGPQQAAALAFFQPLTLSYAVAPALRRMQPSLWRSIDFWQRILPVYVAYKMTQKRAGRLKAEDALALWEKRHQWGSERVYRLCVELGGAYLKNGILLSTRSDFLPQTWCKRLWELPHEGRAMTIEEVRATFLECFSMPMESIFLWYDRTPLASATVAQIHKCEMPDGRLVILKVQYPGQERLCQKDFRNLRVLAQFLQALDLRIDLVSIVREYERLIPLEFDFEREARMMTVIRRNLRQANLDHVVAIPEIVNDLVSRRALVMTYIPGCYILDREKIRGWDLDLRTLLENIAAVFGQMILVDGIFHADPHPGNFVVMQDGRVALLDFGQVKRIREFVRRRLCWLYLAIADCDGPLIAARFQELGVRFDATAGFRSTVVWTPLESRPSTSELAAEQSETESSYGLTAGDTRPREQSSMHSISRIGSFMYSPTDADLALFARFLFDTSTLDELEMNALGSLNPLRFIRFQEYPDDIFSVLRVMRLLRCLADELNIAISMADIFATYAARGIRKVAQVSAHTGNSLERRSNWAQMRRHQSASPMKESRDASPSSPANRLGMRVSPARISHTYVDALERTSRIDRAMSLPNTPLHERLHNGDTLRGDAGASPAPPRTSS